jgi:hypothetical protein
VVAIALCVIFDESARVHMIKTPYYYSISLTFPFIYESNVTVQSPPALPLRKFKFETLLLPSVIIFVVVTALALMAAIAILIFNIVHHGSQEMQEYIRVVRLDLTIHLREIVGIGYSI